MTPKFQTPVYQQTRSESYQGTLYDILREVAVGTDDRIYRRFSWFLNGEVNFQCDWQRDEPLTLTRVEFVKSKSGKIVRNVTEVIERTADDYMTELAAKGYGKQLVAKDCEQA